VGVDSGRREAARRITSNLAKPPSLLGPFFALVRVAIQPNDPGSGIEDDSAEELKKRCSELGRRGGHRSDTSAPVSRLQNQVEGFRSLNRLRLVSFDHKGSALYRVYVPALAAFARRDAYAGEPLQFYSVIDKAFVQSLVDIDGVCVDGIIIAGIYLCPRMNLSKAQKKHRNIRMPTVYH